MSGGVSGLRSAPQVFVAVTTTKRIMGNIKRRILTASFENNTLLLFVNKNCCVFVEVDLGFFFFLCFGRMEPEIAVYSPWDFKPRVEKIPARGKMGKTEFALAIGSCSLNRVLVEYRNKLFFVIGPKFSEFRAFPLQSSAHLL